MGNLFASLLSSTNSLRTIDRALSVVQNNVANASTPGYARQVQSLVAERFQPDIGLTGGVAPGDLISRRSEYLEEAVRGRQSAVGYAGQRASDLSKIEPLFSPEENAGISGALSRFFESVSQASVSPNSSAMRQVVLDRAGEAAKAFQDTAAGLGDARADVDRQIGSTVEAVNKLLGQIRDFNTGRSASTATATDAGVDANLHNALEQLSELVDFKAIQNPDNSLTILLGGAEPAVIGDHLFPIASQTSEAGASLWGAQGQDLTATLGSGRLGALLAQRNTSLPGYQQDLDTLASSFSSQVNQILAQGLDQNGATPTRDLFVSTDPAHPASTLNTVQGFQPADLALAYGTVSGGNGNALRLAALENQKSVAGFTLAEYYGNIGANVGRDLDNARQTQETQTSLLTQAQNLREQQQGVSLDEEAATLMTFQKGYEACAKMIKVLNDLTDVTLSLLPLTMDIHLSPTTQQFLNRLADTTRRMERAQSEISSGKKFTAVSDDPDQVSTLLQTRAELQSCRQVEKNLARVKTEVDTAEQALTSADQLLQNARTVAAQGASSTATQEQRNILAGQVQSMMEHLGSIANTTVEGRFVFSGDADSSPAFALDFAQIPPYGAYLGKAATRHVLAADGSTFNAGLAGDTLFDAPGHSVLGALDQLRTALLSGVDANIATASQNLTGAEDYLGTQHAAYGTIQSRVNSAVDVASKREVTLKTQVGNIEDADLSTAIVEFTNASMNRNAALQAQAQMPRKSLFDYLG